MICSTLSISLLLETYYKNDFDESNEGQLVGFFLLGGEHLLLLLEHF